MTAAQHAAASALAAHLGITGRRIVNAMAFAPAEHLAPALVEGIEREMESRGIRGRATAETQANGDVRVDVQALFTGYAERVNVTIGFEPITDESKGGP